MKSREDYLRRRKELYIKNKEKIAAQNHDRYLRKKDQYLKKSKEWKVKNKDRCAETTRLYNMSVKEKRKIWFFENKEILNKKQRERRSRRTQNQIERDRIYAKEYREKNKDTIKQYHLSISERRRKTRKEYYAKKYRSDIRYKLLHNLRSRIKNAIKCKGRDYTSIELLGCPLATFKSHIESLFTQGMSWSKVLDGSIHIDHIIPCAKFDLRRLDQQKLCFHYTNLQPLWAEDNLKKGAKCLIKSKAGN